MNIPPENPFSDVGCILSGARVIGRDHEIQQLRNKLCTKSGHGSIAVIGMPRIGKSSLIQRALLDDTAIFATAKIVCSRTDVGTLSTFDDLLRSMVRGTLTELRKFSLGGERLETLAAQVFAATGEGGWETAKDFFQALRALQIRPICVLDEFDATRRLFHGHVQPFLRLRHLASSADCKVGLVLVCKRDLATLSQLAALDSNYWHNAVGAELYLRGLDDHGLHSYFALLDQVGISLGNRARDELVHNCGTHPYLLDLFAAEAFPLASTGKVIDRNTCRELATPLLPKAFSQLVEVLRDGSELSELKAALGERPPCHPSTEIQALVRLGVLVQDGHGKLKPFAGTLPEYLSSQEPDLAKPSDRAPVTPSSPQEHSPSPPTSSRQTGRFRFHAGKNALVAANGISTALEPRFSMVLRALFQVDSPGHRAFASCLRYEEVARHYLEGLCIQQQLDKQAAKQAAAEKIKKAGLTAAKNGKTAVQVLAEQFKRDFGRWLKGHSIDINEILTCNSKEGGYQLVSSGWDDPPVIYASEPTQLTAAPETLSALGAPQSGRTPIRDSGI